ncbi:MAG: gene transfer agent family protein [Ahrensia sp.]
MNVNLHRGEISAQLGGAERRLCLTLGALAQLEAAFSVGDLQSLVARFGDGRLSANDLITVLHAGLVGGGHNFSREEVAQLHVDGGVAAYAKIVGELLAATFGEPDA